MNNRPANKRFYDRVQAARAPQEPVELDPDFERERQQQLDSMADGAGRSDPQASPATETWSGKLPWAGPGPYGTFGKLSKQQAGVEKTAHIALGKGIDEKRRQKIIHQAVGQYLRARSETGSSESGAGLGLGLTPAKVESEVARVDREGFGRIIVLPSRRDRAVAAASPYPDGDPPNPYLWIAVASELGLRDRDVVWEIGATPEPSVVSIEAVSQVQVHLPRLHVQPGLLRWPGAATGLPHPGRKVTRWSGGGRAPNPMLPRAVVVPLPLACDAYSIARWTHLWRHTPAEERPWWVDQSPADHPEFTTEINPYMRAVRLRLQWVGSVVPSETQIIVTAREHLGVPGGVRRMLTRRLKWQVVKEAHAYEQPGAAHLGNGSPLDARWVSIWRTP